MLFKCLLNYFNVKFYYYKFLMIWCLELRRKNVWRIHDSVKKDEYNLKDEKDLNKENYEEPKRFLLVDCIEDDQRIVIFPSGLQWELMVKQDGDVLA